MLWGGGSAMVAEDFWVLVARRVCETRSPASPQSLAAAARLESGRKIDTLLRSRLCMQNVCFRYGGFATHCGQVDCPIAHCGMHVRLAPLEGAFFVSLVRVGGPRTLGVQVKDYAHWLSAYLPTCEICCLV